MESKELGQTAPLNKNELSINECISSLETLFNSYKKDSEFNYQLNNSNSPFNHLKNYVLSLNGILKENGITPKENELWLLKKRLNDDTRVFTNLLNYGEKSIEQIENDLKMSEMAKEILKAYNVCFDNNCSSMTIYLNKETADKVRKWLNGK